MVKNNKKRKIGKIIGLLAAVLVIGIIAAAILFSVKVGKEVAEGLLYQNQGNDTKGNSVKQLELWGYDLEQFENQYTPNLVTFTAEDGNEVPAALFHHETSKKTVILVHGLGGEHVCVYPCAGMYLNNDWNVIAIDQRASGDSVDDKVSFGFYEKRDVQAAVDYARNEMLSDTIVVHGQSMGAATAALYSVTEHAEINIDAVILDSCFDSMENMFLSVWREMEGTEGIPEDYIIACGDWYLKKYYGFGFEDADVYEKLKENHVNTLMLHMTEDEMISTKRANEMYENIVAKEKQICYFESEHVKGIIDYPKEYEEAVFSFLSK